MLQVVVERNVVLGSSTLSYESATHHGIRAEEFIFVSPDGRGLQLSGEETPNVLRSLGFSPEMSRRIYDIMTKMQYG